MKVQQQERKQRKLKPKHLLWGIAPVAVVTPTAIAITKISSDKPKGENIKSFQSEEMSNVIQEEVDKVYSETPELTVQIDKADMVKKIQERVKDQRPATLSWVRKFIRNELADLVNSLENIMTHSVRKAMLTIEKEQIDRLYAFYLDKWTEAESIEKVELNEGAKITPNSMWVLFWKFNNPHTKRERDQIVHKDQLVHLVTDIEDWIASAKKYNAEIQSANDSVYNDEYRRYEAFWKMAKELRKVEPIEGADLSENPYEWHEYQGQKYDWFPNVAQIRESMDTIKRWLDNAYRYNDFVERQNALVR